MASDRTEITPDRDLTRDRNQKPTCPVCHKSDKVETLAEAYRQGIQRFAQPPMPVKTVSMLSYMGISMLVVGICVFLIIVLIGSESFGPATFSIGELILVVITIIAIVSALVLSFLAFTRVVKGDQESQKEFPRWDQAMADWRRLRYCARDDVVFDPETGKVVPEDEVRAMISPAMQQEQKQSGTLVHP